ncbi:MAG: two-component regulator propeller domain-containing protein [bacterium]
MKVKIMPFKNVLILIIFTFGTIYSQTWQNYTTDNSPLPSNKIQNLTRSSDGTIWIGTDNGVAAIKNESWKVYSTTDGLSSNNIKSSTLDMAWSDDLWLGSDNGTTNFMVQNTEIISDATYVNISNSTILSNNINSICLDTYHNKWLGTENGISVITNSGTYNLQVGDGMYVNDVRTFGIADTGWVYAGTHGGGVSRFKYNGVDGISGASIIEKAWSGLLSDSVFAIYEAPDGLRWYGTDQGISTHFGESTKRNWWYYNVTNGLLNNYVRVIKGDSHGNIWAGTKSGVSVFDGTTWIHFTTTQGLVGNNVFDIEIDNEDNIWIATDQGLSRLSDVPTGIKDEPVIADNYDLKISNYPNPFNPSTNIEYSINKSSEVKLTVFDVSGKKIRTLIDTHQSAGMYTVMWNGRNDNGVSLASGVYIVAVETKYSRAAKKIMLLR